MKNAVKTILVIVTILAAVAGIAIVLYRLLMGTEHISGTDECTRDSVRYEPMRRRYIKLDLPQ